MRTTMTIIIISCSCAGAALAVQESVPFINADQVRASGITGLGVTVAVIDTGVFYDHPGLIGAIAPGGDSIIGRSFVGDDGEDIWGDGHGTNVSLIITDQAGVAHDARILPIRVFTWYQTPNGPVFGAATMDIVDAIRYTIALRAVDASIQVINLGLGGATYTCPCDLYDPDRADAISDAMAAGIITFAATGNDSNCGEIAAPACDSSAVRVAANYDQRYPTHTYWMRVDGQDVIQCSDYMPPPYWVTCFSNIADCSYLLAAPGYEISVGGITMTGTSQATPHCSGVAALMLDKAGPCGANVSVVKTYIFSTATEMWWAYPFCQSVPIQPRHVNALAAVNAVTAGSCSPVVGDLNCDSILDGSDLDGFSVCMTGPRTDPIGGGCTCADFPASPPDGDVDLHDYMRFQRLFGGGQSTGATVMLDLTSPNAGQTVEPGGTVYWTISATVSAGDNAGLAALSVDLVQSVNNLLVDLLPATTTGTGMGGFIRPAGVSNPETAVAGSGYGGTPMAMNVLQIGGAQNTLGVAGDAGTGEDFTVDAAIGQSGPQIIAQGSFTVPLAAGTYVYWIANGQANVLDVVSPPPAPPAVWPVSAANVVLNSPSFSVTVPYDLAVPDFDHDGDVDQADFALIQACYTGDGYTVAQLFPDGGCDGFDVNGDGYINARDPQIPGDVMGDLDWFEKCASGPGSPADSDCCDCDGHGILDARVSPPDPWINSFDYDGDGVQVLGRPSCINGNTVDCDDNCPCLSNADQADNDAWRDGDGVGDVCDPPQPDPPPPFEVTACRSVRWHGTSGYLGIELDPDADAAIATIEPRQGLGQTIEIELSEPADPVWSDLWLTQVHDASNNAVEVVEVVFGANGTDTQTIVITFVDDPEFPGYGLLDQNCYTIDLSDAVKKSGNQAINGDSDCAIRMLHADTDGDATVETGDVTAINNAIGQTTDASNAHLDIDIDGTITGPDTAQDTDAWIASGLVGNSVICGE